MTTQITDPYKRQGILSIILTAIIFGTIGLLFLALTILALPLGVIFIPFWIVAWGLGCVPMLKVAPAECPHCRTMITVTKNATIFKCRACKRKISKIQETLQAI